MEKYLEQIEKTLSVLFENYQNNITAPGVLLSGGIDSSTITQLINKYFEKYTILSFGTSKTKDKKFVDLFVKNINKDFAWLDVDEKNILENKKTIVDLLIKNNVEANTMQISLATGYFLVFKKASEMGIKTIFTGQGPDIILAGYSKYKKISIDKVNEEIQKDLPLLVIDGKRDNAMASYFGIKLINPYLEKEFIDLCLEIPAEFKLKDNIEKYILRKFAEKVGVPNEIVNRPKKAFQYSTGIQELYQSLH